MPTAHYTTRRDNFRQENHVMCGGLRHDCSGYRIVHVNLSMLDICDKASILFCCVTSCRWALLLVNWIGGETHAPESSTLIHYSSFFGIEGHVALDRNPGMGYNTLLLRLIPWYHLIACPQFHTLSDLIGSHNPTLTHCMPCSEAVCTIFYDRLWYDPVGWRTCDLSHERRTC